MKLIVCLDDNNGMMFNKRRQSRDRVLIENMIELCKDEKLYTNECSVSLFPENTYKNRENGLRADMCKLLEELQPKFLRFPGGCIIEGYDEATGMHYYQLFFKEEN